MVSVLEKLSREFGQKEQDETREGRHKNNVSAQPSCSYTAPSEEQLSCSGVSVSVPRESTFEERLVDKLLEAQQKQFQELRCFVKKEIAATNKRIDDMVISDDDSDLSSDNENGEPSLKRQKMSDDSDQTGTNSAKRGEASVSVLNRLSKMYEPSDKTGPAIDDSLAKIVRGMMNKDRDDKDDKTREELQEKHLRPENCEILITPKVNKEIWRTLPSSARNKDLELQKPQKLLVTAMLPLISSVDVLIKNDPKGENPSTNILVDNIMDAVAMLSHANDDMNGVRRSMIKPSLNTEYRALCSSQNPITANLFGDNIAEQLKTIQEVNKVGKKINNDEKHSKAFSYNKSPRVPFLGSRNSWASGSRKRGASSSGRHPVGMNRHQKKQRGGRQ
ncbi:hypothetical protein FSP39_018007 [Pinctada imbricata]|uniref:Uncharacterized protein n=1 Tax=Pinctada imbricata TaxID=66713 RepID=A0AA88XNZ7_PINIB|nr:hypothetical protein FSP39_018007 [Pinctada imbricata]